MQNVMRALSVVLLTACAARQAPNEVPREGGYRPPEVIERNTSWEDLELAAKGLGRMEFAVRVSGRPTQAVQQALVGIQRVGDLRPTKQALTDDRGVVAFDSIAVARYQLTVRSIGYAQAKSDVDVLPGCRTDVEIYIGIQAIGLNPPTPEPTRVRVTTCRASR